MNIYQILRFYYFFFEITNPIAHLLTKHMGEYIIYFQFSSILKSLNSEEFFKSVLSILWYFIIKSWKLRTVLVYKCQNGLNDFYKKISKKLRKTKITKIMTLGYVTSNWISIMDINKNRIFKVTIKKIFFEKLVCSRIY